MNIFAVFSVSVFCCHTPKCQSHDLGKQVCNVHLEPVRVIYNVQRFSEPCASLMSLLAALSPEPAVLNGEMNASL